MNEKFHGRRWTRQMLIVSWSFSTAKTATTISTFRNIDHITNRELIHYFFFLLFHFFPALISLNNYLNVEIFVARVPKVNHICNVIDWNRLHCIVQLSEYLRVQYVGLSCFLLRNCTTVVNFHEFLTIAFYDISYAEKLLARRSRNWGLSLLGC